MIPSNIRHCHLCQQTLLIFIFSSLFILYYIVTFSPGPGLMSPVGSSSTFFPLTKIYPFSVLSYSINFFYWPTINLKVYSDLLTEYTAPQQKDFQPTYHFLRKIVHHHIATDMFVSYLTKHFQTIDWKAWKIP